jgi:hypothetical protein
MMDANLIQGNIIPTDWLKSTDLEASEDPIIGTLVPNFFIIYFGQDLPYGNINDDELMLKLARMGKEYELWAETAKDTIDNFNDISTILDKIDDIEHPEWIKQYLDPNRNNISFLLTKANGPFGSVTIIQTSDYPAAVLSLKEFYFPAPTTPHTVIFLSRNVMTLQLPGDIDKEAEAKKGLIKLILFHVQGNVDIEATSVSSITAAIPLKAMQIIMNQNRASHPSSFADLMRMTINEAKVQDWTSIRSSQISIKLLSKALASHMLQGNFAIKKVTSFEHETEKVEPSAFLPQRNKCIIDCELTTKNRATNENVMNIINSKKSTCKTAISHIGTMIDIIDYSSICINMHIAISAICTSNRPQPIFCQILMNFVSLVNNPDWAKWAKSIGSMPLIQWYCYSFLEHILNCFVDFATNFRNKNIMYEAHPIIKLNTKGFGQCHHGLQRLLYSDPVESSPDDSHHHHA